MISFLLEEGIITIGAISGIFTSNLLSSFKTNIIDPACEHFLPTEKLDKHLSETSKDDKVYKKLKHETFLKDFVTWFIVIFILFVITYLIRKKTQI